MTLPFIARSWSAAVLLCGVSGVSHADTVWQCWYDRALHVACSLSRAAPATALDAAQKQALAMGAAAAAKPGRVPLLVQVLHTNPGALRGQFVRIPLHTEPTDPMFVAELAQSVMCGRQTDCRANYGSRPERDLNTATAMADTIDPVSDAGQPSRLD